ncbi:quinate permease [Penicillium malachiteum]|uniref:quinate permease n=1 Tax=Penicillium malachiteum TaxID=1324776 RepID=UPI002546EA5C|nr:quinate permease [Penicillium malachiteum]KAJ5725539.1 quinate permease [Penicillium malachiteum]
MSNFLMRNLLSQEFTLKLLYGALCFGLSGAARGLDEGLIASTVSEESFIRKFHLDAAGLSATEKANRLSNVTSMVHMGSLPGAILGFLLCEWIGILWTMRELCLIWIVGLIVFLTSHTLDDVYIGRFFMGLGIGQAGVIAPVYLAEISPPRIRGMMYFAIWGASIHISNSSSTQWIVPQSVQAMWAVFLFILSLFCEESPRFLCKKGTPEKACEVFARLWGLHPMDPAIQTEMRNIRKQLKQEEETTGWYLISSLKELFTQRSNLRRIIFILCLQVLSQWSGPNSKLAYAPELFGLFGISGQDEKLFATAIFGLVKLISALICAVLLIDRLGRKKTLYIGITLQVLALIYDSIFLTVYSNLSSSNKHSSSTMQAAVGSIVFMYFIGVGWAMGWNSIQYLVTAETFPLRVRLCGASLATCIHFGNRIGTSKATPYLLLNSGLTPAGTFWFFTGVSLLGLIFAIFYLPETSGKGLEETNQLYAGLPASHSMSSAAGTSTTTDASLPFDPENIGKTTFHPSGFKYFTSLIS